MFCCSKKVNPLPDATRALISMAQSSYPVTLEALCLRLVRHIPIPETSRDDVDRFVGRVITEHRDKHADTVRKYEYQFSEYRKTLRNLTEMYDKLATTVEDLMKRAAPRDVIMDELCAKDTLIQDLRSEIDRLIDDEKANRTCKVCAEDMPSDKAYANRCGHILCWSCWRKLEGSNSFCPFCRDIVVCTHRVFL